MTFTIANIIELFTLLIIGGGLFMRIGQLTKTVADLQKALEKMDTHVDLVPILQRDIQRHEEEIQRLRDRWHKTTGHVQWLLTVVEERAGRPPHPSGSDLSLDYENDPGTGKGRR
jgi:hypothetical protein